MELVGRIARLESRLKFVKDSQKVTEEARWLREVAELAWPIVEELQAERDEAKTLARELEGKCEALQVANAQMRREQAEQNAFRQGAEAYGEFMSARRDYIATLQQSLSEAQAENKELEDSNDALHAKLTALAPHGSCACDYDRPGDVCAHHSPRLMAVEAELQAERERLGEADKLLLAVKEDFWWLMTEPNTLGEAMEFAGKFQENIEAYFTAKESRERT